MQWATIRVCCNRSKTHPTFLVSSLLAFDHTNGSAFADQAQLWEQRLAELDQSLAKLQAVQRRWVHLEPIFSRGALPREQGRFKAADTDVRELLAGLGSRVVGLARGLGPHLDQILDQVGAVCVLCRLLTIAAGAVPEGSQRILGGEALAVPAVLLYRG